MSYVVAGEWPRARLVGPLSAHLAQELARRLSDALAGTTLSAAATRAGINRATLSRLLSGAVLPDLDTLCRLHVLSPDLVPDRGELDRLAASARPANS